MTNEEKMMKAVDEFVRVAGERYTKFLKMYLPGENNYYRVEADQNQNFEKIDGALENAQRMAIDLFSKKQDKQDTALQTADKTVVGGINELNSNITTVDKYVDGLAGDNVGSFPLSRATEGQVYRVPQTNKYYVCVSNYNGGTISLPNGSFEELSVWKNREHFNNLKTEFVGQFLQKRTPFKISKNDELLKKSNVIVVTSFKTYGGTSDVTYQSIIPTSDKFLFNINENLSLRIDNGDVSILSNDNQEHLLYSVSLFNLK